MKIMLVCEKCSGGDPNKVYELCVDICDDGLYEATCPNGHKIVEINQNPKFELLFDSGSLAFIHGFYREAVSSWAAALERFFEFYVRVLSEKNEIDPEQFEETWKFVSSSSERQLAVFLLTYLLTNKVSFSNLLTKNEFDKQSKFRNEVIHKGHFKKRDESFNYGEFVYNLINSLLEEIKGKYMEEIQKTLSKQLAQIYKKTDGPHYDPDTKSYHSPGTIWHSRMISVNRVDSPKSFGDALKNLDIP